MAIKTTTTRKKTAIKTTKKSATHTKPTSTAKKSAKKKTTTKKYGPLAGKEVAKEMREYKKGTAKSGKSETPVKSRKQAIAIGLSKARAKGAKIPKKKTSTQ